MKELELAIKLFWKYKKWNLLVIITMVSSILYLLPMLEQQVHYMESSDILQRLDMENAYYLYSNPFYTRQNPAFSQSVEEQIENSGYVKEAAEIYHLFDEKQQYAVSVYNDVLIQKFCPKLKEGHWIYEEMESGFIPVVAMDDTGLSCGQNFEIKVLLGEEEQNFSCQVVGIADDNTFVMAFLQGADEEYFTSDALIENTPFAIIMPLVKELEESISEEKHLFRAGGRILYIEDSISQEQISQDFGYAGMVLNLKRAGTRFYEQTRANMKALGVYFVMYLLITIICLLCNTIISNIRLKKIYTIYFLNGMSMKSYRRIELFRIAIFVVVSAALTVGIIFQMGYFKQLFEKVPIGILCLGIVLYSSMIFLPAIWFLWKRTKKTNFLTEIQELKID